MKVPIHLQKGELLNKFKSQILNKSILIKIKIKVKFKKNKIILYNPNLFFHLWKTTYSKKQVIIQIIVLIKNKVKKN